MIFNIKRKHDKQRLEIRVELTSETCRPGQRTIDLEPVERAIKLSISGEVVLSKYMQASGQCSEDVAKFAAQLPPADRSALRELCLIWRRWHLNDLRAGTRTQLAVLDVYEAEHRGWRYTYEGACEVLEEAGYLVDRGYKYGAEWLIEPVPAAVAERLTTLCNQLSKRRAA